MKNPYPDEPIGTQPTDSLPPMEELQPRMNLPPAGMPPLPPAAPPPASPPVRAAVATKVEQHEEEFHTAIFVIGKLEDFLQWFAIVLEVVLLIRFIFRLIGADPANVFASALYAITSVILYPFLNIVPSPSLRPYQAFEFSTLIAMAIYALVFWAAKRFLHIIINRPEDSPE